MKVIVTSYTNPDLDGVACAIAYAELLQTKKIDAEAALFGTPHQEAEYVLSTYKIQTPPDANELIETDTQVVLVDASDLHSVSSSLSLEQVSEVIDHRAVNDADKFTQATIQIELVGSCATLIAEKFFVENITPSEHSALLLYAAIISNTVNFQASVSTHRDKKMAEWLLGKCTLPSGFIHDMFAAKSKFDKPLNEVLVSDFATFEFSGIPVGIAQLEIIDGENFVEHNRQELQEIMEALTQERSLQVTFLTVVDIEKAKNIFYTGDEATQRILQNVLKISFSNNTAIKNGITMRKSITPLLKEYFASESALKPTGV